MHIRRTLLIGGALALPLLGGGISYAASASSAAGANSSVPSGIPTVSDGPDASDGSVVAPGIDNPTGHQDPPGADVTSTSDGLDTDTADPENAASSEADTGPRRGGNSRVDSQVGGNDTAANG
jgi:hypothetical protein